MIRKKFVQNISKKEHFVTFKKLIVSYTYFLRKYPNKQM